MIGGTININPNLVAVGGDTVKKWVGDTHHTDVNNPDIEARIIGDALGLVWQDTLDTGKELRDMAASRERDRIHGYFLRGKNDPWTALTAAREHQVAAKGMGSFTTKEVSGAHFLAPNYILGAFQEMDRTIAASTLKPVPESKPLLRF